VFEETGYDYDGQELQVRDRNDIISDRLKFVNKILAIISQINSRNLDRLEANINALYNNLRVDYSAINKDYQEEEKKPLNFDSKIKFDFFSGYRHKQFSCKSIIPITTSGNEEIENSDFMYSDLDVNLAELLDYRNNIRGLIPIDPGFGGEMLTSIWSIQQRISEDMLLKIS
jgi:hypothetical protein